MKCLNCGAENLGKYCQFCGSEMPHEATPVTITNNFFGKSDSDSGDNEEGACCPKCGATKINFKRERTGTTGRSSSKSKLFTSGRKGRYTSQTSYRTIGICQKCGYSWIPGSNDSSAEKKSNLKWWVLGWIFVFPIPLTIIMLRNKSLNKWLRYSIIALAWLIYIVWIASASANKKDTKKNSVVNQTENTTIQTTTAPESTTSETSASVSVESIDIDYPKDPLFLGQSYILSAIVKPENATDKAVVWKTSDSNIVSVSEDGVITAKAGGTAKITAESKDGVTSSAEITVDGSKRQMTVKTTYLRDDKNNIGDEWSHSFLINGESAAREYLVSVGDEFKCSADFREDDSNPDKGSASATHKVTAEDLENGFEVKFDLYVTENGGKNSGKKAHFIVNFVFSV